MTRKASTLVNASRMEPAGSDVRRANAVAVAHTDAP